MQQTNRIYHVLDDPLHPCKIDNKYSCLQELYPGMPMEKKDDPDRYDIPHKDPQSAQKTFEENKLETKKYVKNLENITRIPDSDKVTFAPVEDPSTPIEDPDLKFISTDSVPVDPLIVNSEKIVENFQKEEEEHNNIYYIAGGLVLIILILFFSKYKFKLKF